MQQFREAPAFEDGPKTHTTYASMPHTLMSLCHSMCADS